MIDAYPLTWPPGWPRSKYPRRASFRATMASGRDGILRELRLMGAREVIISSNVPLNTRGMLAASTTQPEDTGVAVYFKLNDEDQCIPSDRWNRVEHNLRAIEKTIDALRGIERWGAKEMVNAAFRGFKALPEGGAVETESPHQILGVDPDATTDEITKAFRTKAKEHHPDQGGDDQQFQRVQRAYQAIK